MSIENNHLIKDIEKNLPLDDQTFDSVLRSIDCKFPPDYLDFMRQYNGGEGEIPNGQWLILWPIEQLKSYNEMYGVAEFAPALLLVGSNGGAMAYGIKRNEGVFFEVEFVRLSESAAIEIGRSFDEFLSSLSYFVQGQTEYMLARIASDRANKKIHKENASLKGMHVHEIQPVILGGHPTDAANKILLASADHSKYTRFWKSRIDQISNGGV